MSLLVVPVGDAASADQLTFNQSHMVHVGCSILYTFMAGNAYGCLHDYYLLFYLLPLVFPLT